MIGITERGDAALSTNWTEWVLLGHPAILITKAPGTLLKTLLGFPSSAAMNIIVHGTITGLGGTKIEPKVPPPGRAIRDLIDLDNFLKDRFQEETSRIVLRVDPIIPSKRGWKEQVEEGLGPLVLHPKFTSIPVGSNWRMRTSFLDAYRHVRERFGKEAPVGECYLDWEGLHAPLETRMIYLEKLQNLFSREDIEICGEPGMNCTGCISKRDLEIFGLSPSLAIPGGWQRPACACLSFKKELLKEKSQCEHECLYCYWQ